LLHYIVIRRGDSGSERRDEMNLWKREEKREKPER
jgi:hypothetical protein